MAKKVLAALVALCMVLGMVPAMAECETHDWSNHDGICAVCLTECEHPGWSEGVCTQCGWACTHENAQPSLLWTENTTKEGKDGGTECIIVWHNVQPVLNCTDCGMTWNNGDFMEEYSEVGEHHYQWQGDERVCMDCGHVFYCPHENSWRDYRETEESEYLYEDGGKTCILTITNVQFFYYCEDCHQEWNDGDVVAEYRVGNRAHSYEGTTICAHCGHDNSTCEHANTLTVLKNTSDTKMSFIDGGNDCIMVMTNVQPALHCKDCGAEWDDGDFMEEYRETRAHYYGGKDFCANCGHVCTHENSHTENRTTENTKYRYEDAGTYCVRYLTDLQPVTLCDDCGTEWNDGELIEEMQGEFDHIYEGNICKNCGHDNSACEHINTYQGYIYTDNTEELYEDGGAYCIRTLTNVQPYIHCIDCGAEWNDGGVISEKTEQLTHDYNGSNLCTRCGHDNSACEHINTSISYWYTDSTEELYEDIGAYCKMIVTNVQPVVNCMDCGAVWNDGDLVAELDQGTFSHEYEGNICVHCGHDNGACEHANIWSSYRYTESTEESWEDGDFYCIRTATNVQPFIHCEDCGAEWDDGDLIPEKTGQLSHDYGDDNICTHCGHDSGGCEHLRMCYDVTCLLCNGWYEGENVVHDTLCLEEICWSCGEPTEGSAMHVLSCSGKSNVCLDCGATVSGSMQYYTGHDGTLTYAKCDGDYHTVTCSGCGEEWLDYHMRYCDGDTCFICGESYTGEMFDHRGYYEEDGLEIRPVYNPDGTTDVHRFYCSCGEDISEGFGCPDGAAHKPVVDAGYEATATSEGLTDGSHCELCGVILEEQEVIPIDDTLKKQEVIPACAHTAVTDYGYEATCTENGLTDGSHCSLCGQVLEAQQTIRAAGHVYGEAVIVPATCLEDGLQTEVCDACGFVLETVLPAIGHSYQDVYVCLNNGTHGAPCLHEGCDNYNVKPCELTEQIVGSLKISSCPVCGYTVTEVLEQAADEPVNAVAQAMQDTIQQVIAASLSEEQSEEGQETAKISVVTEVKLETTVTLAPEEEPAEAMDTEENPEAEETEESAMTVTLVVYEQKVVSDALEDAVPLHVYNMALVSDGEAVELKGTIRVELPCDSEEAETLRNLALVVIAPDGSLKQITFEIIDGKIVFDTDVVGTFAFVDAALLSE